MSDRLPEKCPACVVSMLARQEWFADPEVVSRARLAKAGGIPRLLSSQKLAGRKIGAITLGSTIYFREIDQYDPHTVTGLVFLAHEIKHVEQYQREGFVRFYIRYLWDYILHGYGESISFEAEASEFERQVMEHLTREFENNSGSQPCSEMAEPHTPNERFAKTVPLLFRFSI